jgi:hypothetical protein
MQEQQVILGNLMRKKQQLEEAKQQLDHLLTLQAQGEEVELQDAVAGMLLSLGEATELEDNLVVPQQQVQPQPQPQQRAVQQAQGSPQKVPSRAPTPQQQQHQHQQPVRPQERERQAAPQRPPPPPPPAYQARGAPPQQRADEGAVEEGEEEGGVPQALVDALVARMFAQMTGTVPHMDSSPIRSVLDVKGATPRQVQPQAQGLQRTVSQERPGSAQGRPQSAERKARILSEYKGEGAAVVPSAPPLQEDEDVGREEGEEEDAVETVSTLQTRLQDLLAKKAELERLQEQLATIRDLQVGVDERARVNK